MGIAWLSIVHRLGLIYTGSSLTEERSSKGACSSMEPASHLSSSSGIRNLMFAFNPSSSPAVSPGPSVSIFNFTHRAQLPHALASKRGVTVGWVWEGLRGIRKCSIKPLNRY